MYQVPFEVSATSYEEALEILAASKRFGIQPMLESVEDMLVELGNPDECFESVQIAGTNGKTSTARYTAAILAGEGLRVALYTSPELVSLTERMEIMGHPVSEDVFAYGVAAANAAAEHVNRLRSSVGARPYDITEFDLLTVAALVIFALAGIDVAVLECGMGGRWDATSATRNIRAVAITGIGLDHTRILGDTLEKIAAEKAAIIRRGRRCVLGTGTATPDSVEDVFLTRCTEQDVRPVLVRPKEPADAAGVMHPGVPRDHKDLPRATFHVSGHPDRIGAALTLDVDTLDVSYRDISALKPSYQAANIACAIVLAQSYLARPLDTDALYDSVVACPTPGRFDLVRPKPPVLVDACHNPQSVKVFLGAVHDVHPDKASRPALLVAVLADKDVSGIVGLLAGEFPKLYVTQTASDRALAAGRLAEAFEAAGQRPEAVYTSLEDAVLALKDSSYVACGSITCAGEVTALLRPGVQDRGGNVSA